LDSGDQETQAMFLNPDCLWQSVLSVNVTDAVDLDLTIESSTMTARMFEFIFHSLDDESPVTLKKKLKNIALHTFTYF
jgi:hypothetical protein